MASDIIERWKASACIAWLNGAS